MEAIGSRGTGRDFLLVYRVCVSLYFPPVRAILAPKEARLEKMLSRFLLLSNDTYEHGALPHGSDQR